MRMDESVFGYAFAEKGQKAAITDTEYKGGWFNVVGGINGIPTSQQFNMIMNFQEEKVNYLYRLLKEIDIAALFNLDDIQKAFDEVFCFRYLPYYSVIEACFRQVYTHEPDRIIMDTGLTWEDYGTEIAAEEIRDMICADWDGEDASYYDNCAETAEEQYHIVFGDSGEVPVVPDRDSIAMTTDDILEAMSIPWDGQTSQDSAALSAVEITEAINTPWNGQTSQDSAALSVVEITEAIKNTAL